MAAVLSIDASTNHQPKIGCYGGGALLMRRDRGGTRGVDYFLPFWGGERGDQRERERDWASALSGRP